MGRDFRRSARPHDFNVSEPLNILLEVETSRYHQRLRGEQSKTCLQRKQNKPNAANWLDDWSKAEDECFVAMFAEGEDCFTVADALRGRLVDECKVHWYTSVRRKHPGVKRPTLEHGGRRWIRRAKHPKWPRQDQRPNSSHDL